LASFSLICFSNKPSELSDGFDLVIPLRLPRFTVSVSFCLRFDSTRIALLFISALIYDALIANYFKVSSEY